jgi:hypothetical protein
MSILAIGEPDVNKVHIYTSGDENFGKEWQLETILSVPEAFTPQHR